MRTSEKLLIIAAIVLPLLAALLIFQPQIRDWAAALVTHEVRSPDAVYACVREVDIATKQYYTVTPWCRTPEEAREFARQNGYRDDLLMVWYAGEKSPRLVEGGQ